MLTEWEIVQFYSEQKVKKLNMEQTAHQTITDLAEIWPNSKIILGVPDKHTGQI